MVCAKDFQHIICFVTLWQYGDGDGYADADGAGDGDGDGDGAGNEDDERVHYLSNLLPPTLARSSTTFTRHAPPSSL